MTDRLRLSCSDVDDLSALYVLDALGAAEAAEVAAHLADHPDRHAAFREMAGVTPFLAESVPPLAPPPDLRARVLGQVAVTPQAAPATWQVPAAPAPVVAPEPVVARPAQVPPPGPEAAPLPVAEPYPVQNSWTPAVTPVESVAPAAPPAPISLDAAREAKRRRNPVWAVLAAAAVLAIVALGGWNLVLQQQQSQNDQRLAVLSAAVAAAGQPDSLVAQLTGTDTAAGASGYAVFPAAGTGYIVLTGLPAAGDGQAWQAWTIAGESPASAGLMDVGSDGVAVLDGIVALPGTSVVALTVEPAGGSQQPTTTPVVVGQLDAPIAWTGGLLALVPQAEGHPTAPQPEVPAVRSRFLVSSLLAGALLVPALPVAGQSPSTAPRPGGPGSPGPLASVAIGDPDLARAVAATVATGTVRTAFSAVFTGTSAVPDGTTISGEGQTSFGLERHQRLSMDMTALDIGAFELIIDGDTIYARGLPLGPDVPEGAWLTADLTSDDPTVDAVRSLASGNNDASLLLYYLLGAPGPAELVGEDVLDGVATRHLRTPLDLDRALPLVPVEMQATLAENLAEIRSGGVEPVLQAEVWVDAADLVRRVLLAYTLGEATGGGTMTVTFDFRQHGEPLDLGIPAPEDTVDISTLGG